MKPPQVDSDARQRFADGVSRAAAAAGFGDFEAEELSLRARRSVDATSEACFSEAALLAALSGDEAAFRRAAPDATWEDRAWALLLASEAERADGADAAVPSGLAVRGGGLRGGRPRAAVSSGDDAAASTARGGRVLGSSVAPASKGGGGLGAVAELRGTALQAACGALALHGARAIPDLLRAHDGVRDAADGASDVVCRVNAALALVWRRQCRDSCEDVDDASICDSWLAVYAARLSATPATVHLSAYYGAPLGAACLERAAECLGMARGVQELSQCLRVAELAFGKDDVLELARCACDYVFSHAGDLASLRRPAADVGAASLGDEDALRVGALAWLANDPVELLRHANALLSYHGGRALRRGASDDWSAVDGGRALRRGASDDWSAVDAVLARVPDAALDSCLDVTRKRGPDDALAAAVFKAHLGWRAARAAAAKATACRAGRQKAAERFKHLRREA